MIDEQLLAILVCPETKQRLRLAPAELLEELNNLAAQGELYDRAGRRVEPPLQAGLLREDGKVLYPIVDEIPDLLVNDGVVVPDNLAQRFANQQQ